MGKNKPSVVRALERLADSPLEVAAVVARSQPGPGGVLLGERARTLGLPVLSYAQLARQMRGEDTPTIELRGIDYIFSFLFWRLIREPVLDWADRGCLNFHPAPLPDYRGWGVYNFAILRQEPLWGVSAHWVSAELDRGDLVRVDRFAIEPERETAYSLEQRSQVALVELFGHVLDSIARGEALPRTPQGEGHEFPRAATEAERRVRPDDSPEMVDRRIRAFWYPPYGGATTEIGGEEYVLLNRALLDEVGHRYHGK